MKTKLSKRILSVFLAALMIVTSIPLMASNVFADVDPSDVSTMELDSYAKALNDEMKAFALKLDGTVYSNISQAYTAYVNAQKAFDAYVYGTADSSTTVAAKDALKAASEKMTAYTGKMTGNAVPRFPNDDGTIGLGEGYSNLLYHPTPVEVGSLTNANVITTLVQSNNAVLLYDGQTEVRMPVMFTAKVNANKNRYVYAIYPTDNTTNGSTDSAAFQLVNYWRNGDISGGKGDGQLNWTWNNWTYYGAQNGQAICNTPSYNVATGYHGISAQTTGHRSQKLDYTTKGFGSFNYGYLRTAANAFKLVDTYKVKDWNDEITLNWYISTGDSANSDYGFIKTTTPIKIVNYKTFADQIAAKYNWFKSIELENYSENTEIDNTSMGRLIALFDAATSYNPNTDFNDGSKDGYSACVNNMKKYISDIDSMIYEISNSLYGADAYANDASYSKLRTTMNKLMTTYNKGVNVGYTDASWNGFVSLWNQATSIMNAVAVDGYTSTGRASTVADQLASYKLVTNVVKVKTAELEAVIDTYEITFKDIFTAETTNALKSLIDEAKTTVWVNEAGDASSYKNTATLLNAEGQNQNIVDTYTANIVADIKALRVSPAAVVATTYGRYSLDTAKALEANVAANKDDYGNYIKFQTALNNAAAYTASLADLAMDFSVTTDRKGIVSVTSTYNDMYAQYVSVIENIVDTYQSLARALTKTANGQIMKTVKNQTINIADDHDGSMYYVDFTLPSQVVLFKTTHGAEKFKYGEASLEWRINIDNNIGKDMNALDSITFNTTSTTSGINNTSWALGLSAYPPDMSDAQKQQYAGQLSYTVDNGNGTSSVFDLSNLRVASQYNNRKTEFGITANGDYIYDANSPEFTNILASTDGIAYKRPVKGAIPLQPVNKGDASITFAGDMSLAVPGHQQQTLSAYTLPTVENYTMTGNYLGATYTYHTQPSTMQKAGYSFMSSYTGDPSTSTAIYSTVAVINIAYLLDLIKECSALTSVSDNFTSESWAALNEALAAANLAIEYTDKTSTTAIKNELEGRYTTLWDAYNALEIPVTFVAKNADGTDKVTTVNVLRNHYINDALNASELGKTTNYLSQLNTALTSVDRYYSADNMTRYTFSGWSADVDTDSKITAKATYRAEYDASPNLADFSAYDSAKAALRNALAAQDRYTVVSLQAVKTALEGLTYYNMTAQDKEAIYANAQTAINAEAASLTAIKNNLVVPQLDLVAAKAYKEAKFAEKDIDVYDLSVGDLNYTSVVTIDGIDVSGLVYTTQAALDTAIANALNGLAKKVYNICFNGEVIGTAEYGESIVVDSAGVLHKNVPTDTNFPDLDLAAWSYSYGAPSRGINQATGEYNKTADKYVLTGTSFGFVVKGDSYLTTSNASASENTYVVKFVTDGGKVFDVKYTSGELQMPTAPAYAFYKFAGYDNGLAAGDTFTVTGDMVITASYVPSQAEPQFQIDYMSTQDDWWSKAATDSYTVNYNTLLTLENPDAYCWAIGGYDESIARDTYTILGFGTSYSFYVCEDLNVDSAVQHGIVALTKDVYDTIVTDSTDDVTGQLKENALDVLYDGSGLPVLLQRDMFGQYTKVSTDVVTVNVVENVFEIYAADGTTPEKFSMIGSVTTSGNCKVIEKGILFSTNENAVLRIKNVGTNGVARMKSSKTMADGQFVINVKTNKNVNNFQYAAYAIVEINGELVEYYSRQVTASTNF